MSGLFGGGTKEVASVTPATPTTVAPAPDRTDAQTQSMTARQKARFTAPGSFTNNYLSGGTAGGVSTTARLLGGS